MFPSAYLGRMLPETDVARARRLVESRNDRRPDRARGLIRYELDIAARHVTVLECGPPWKPEYGSEWTRFPVVRLQYTKSRKEWATYWRDRNLEFHRYELFPPSGQLEVLLAKVDEDCTGILWG